MTVDTTSQGGRDRSCIGFELCVQGLKGGVGRCAMDGGELFVLKVCVLDTGSTGGQHGGRSEKRMLLRCEEYSGDKHRSVA